jgi:hypothetical protein
MGRINHLRPLDNTAMQGIYTYFLQLICYFYVTVFSYFFISYIRKDHVERHEKQRYIDDCTTSLNKIHTTSDKESCC